MSFFSFFILINALFYEKWDNHLIKILAIVYGLPDTISLLRIPNLPFSTQVHHSTVTVLWIANYFQNIEIFHYWRGIVIYALFSILCGSVNGYLGFRIIFPDTAINNCEHFLCA